jgi:hypothetical protein
MAIAIGHDGSTLYAGTWSDGLYRSLDRGDTWSQLVGPPNPFVRRLASVVPAGETPLTCDLLYAGTANGLFVRNMAGFVDYRIHLPVVYRDW